MSLRFRLFALFGGLLALLVGAELWLVRSLTRDLSVELERVATSVGRDVIKFLRDPLDPARNLGPPDGRAVRFRGHLEGPERQLLERLRERTAGSAASRDGKAEGTGEAAWVAASTTTASPALPGLAPRASDQEGATSFSYVITADARELAAGKDDPKPPTVSFEGPKEPAQAIPGGAARPAGVKVIRQSHTETVTGPDGKPITRQVLSELRISTSGGQGGVPRVIVLEAPGLPRPSVIDIPQKGMDEAVGRFRDRLLFGSLGILGVGLLGAAVVAVRVTAPLRQLASAARQVGEGAFGAQVSGGGAGEVGEAIGAFNRMSSRLQALEAEALALKEREHLSELGEVGRGLAHALRNPLHAVGLSLDELAALSREEERERADELSESARRQMRHVDDSIRSFLALASGGAGNEESVNVRALVEEVALTALHDARGRVRLTVSPSAGDGPRLRAVPAELKAALQALVVNAIEASPEGGHVDVNVSGLSDGGGARVEVVDEGPGLPAEVRGKLFTPHVTTKPAGSGMGLFLAHRLSTTRYAGDLRVADREGASGTVATLTLRDRVASGGGAERHA